MMRVVFLNGLGPITALMLREIASARSWGAFGYFWALLEPVLTIGILSILLAFAFQAPPLGNSFALFYASGVVPLMMFSAMTTKSGQAVTFSRPLFQFAGVTVVGALIARFTLAALTQVLVACLVLVPLVAWQGLSVGAGRLVVGFGCLFLLAAGFSAVNCWLSVLWRVWHLIWGVVLRPMLVVSGVFFVLDDLPDPQRSALLWNPIAHIISLIRSGIYPFYTADLANPGYVSLVGAIALAVGLAGLVLSERGLANVHG